jgi:hypothetical protein
MSHDTNQKRYFAAASNCSIDLDDINSTEMQDTAEGIFNIIHQIFKIFLNTHPDRLVDVISSKKIKHDVEKSFREKGINISDLTTDKKYETYFKTICQIYGLELSIYHTYNIDTSRRIMKKTGRGYDHIGYITYKPNKIYNSTLRSGILPKNRFSIAQFNGIFGEKYALILSGTSASAHIQVEQWHKIHLRSFTYLTPEEDGIAAASGAASVVSDDVSPVTGSNSVYDLMTKATTYTGSVNPHKRIRYDAEPKPASEYAPYPDAAPCPDPPPYPYPYRYPYHYSSYGGYGSPYPLASSAPASGEGISFPFPKSSRNEMRFYEYLLEESRRQLSDYEGILAHIDPLSIPQTLYSALQIKKSAMIAEVYQIESFMSNFTKN